MFLRQTKFNRLVALHDFTSSKHLCDNFSVISSFLREDIRHFILLAAKYRDYFFVRMNRGGLIHYGVATFAEEKSAAVYDDAFSAAKKNERRSNVYLAECDSFYIYR